MLKKQIKILDGLWSEVIKTRAHYSCEHCRIRGIRMEAAHVVGRRHRATRWFATIGGVFDLCGHCLCHNCHQQYDEHGPLEDAIVQLTVGVLRKALIQKEANRLVAKEQDFECIKSILEGEYDKYKDKREDDQRMVVTQS